MEFKLIIKKINNTLTKEEESTFKEWYDESETHRNYFSAVKKNYKKDFGFINKRKAWKTLEKKTTLKSKFSQLWKYSIAASALIIFGLMFIDDTKDAENPSSISIIEHDTFESDKNKAILSLEDGSEVVLGKGKTYNKNNVSVKENKLVYKSSLTDREKLVYNVLTIPRGGKFFVQLADGTQVWLNSDSKLRYPVKFVSGEAREVELLYGEAYFDVSQASDHNGDVFKVQTRAQEIEVLGTEFNIKAYQDENDITTTLVEGKIAIDNGFDSKFLKPLEQSKINSSTHDISIKKIDKLFDEIAWKDGYFSFKNKSMAEIMKTLSRWYNVDYVFENSENENKKFTGVLDRESSINQILIYIEKTNVLKFKINDNTVIIE